jgi:hypothetical protein
MVPDLAYYVSPAGSYFQESAHTLARSVTFCLPMGSLIVVFVYLTRQGWKQLLPVEVPRGMRPPSLWMTPLAVWLGALTHIFWDSWTHADGYFVVRWPGLPYKWLQHASTLIGMAILAIRLSRRLRLRRQHLGPVLVFWAISLLLAAAITGAGFHPGDPHALTDRRRYFLLLSSFLGVWLLELAATAGTLSLRAKTRNGDSISN